MLHCQMPKLITKNIYTCVNIKKVKSEHCTSHYRSVHMFFTLLSLYGALTLQHFSQKRDKTAHFIEFYSRLFYFKLIALFDFKLEFNIIKIEFNNNTCTHTNNKAAFCHYIGHIITSQKFKV